jgi:PAS domain S-box-containing protein
MMNLLHTDDTVCAKLVQDTPLAIVVSTREDGQILDVNDRFLSLTGYNRDEVIGQSTLGLGLWASPKQHEDLIAMLKTGNPVRDFEARIRTKTADERRALATVLDIEIDGRTCLLTQLQDVTTYQLEHSQFQALVEQIPVITYTHGLDEGLSLTYISPQVETILGYSPAEVLAGQPDFLTSRTHPDDRERVRMAIDRWRTTLHPFRAEYRVQARDGRWVWLQDESVLVRDEHRRPLLWQGVLVDVSAVKSAEEALRHREAQFRALAQNSSDIILVLDSDGTASYVSPSIERVLGYSAVDLLGHNPTAHIQPEHVPRLWGAIETCLRGVTDVPVLELSFRHRDGGWRHFETVVTNLLEEPTVRGIVFNSRDVTARKATGVSLRESEERFRSAFDHAPIGMALITRDGRFTQVNRALCELLGYTEQELLNKTSQDVTHPEDLEDDLALATRLWTGEVDTYQTEKRYLHKSGHPVWTHLTGSVARDAGGLAIGIAQIQDISAQRHLALERATLLASERAYSRQLRALTEMRADLTTIVAHELRSPVAAIRMMIAMLATGELDRAEEAETLAAIDTQIDQIDRLIVDVATTAAADREDFSVQLHPVPLTMLLDEAMSFVRAALRNHPVATTTPPHIQVWCDPERISQVLRNLLENVAKHTPPGTPVALRAHAKGQQVEIEVADQGPGIPADDLSLIFEKFGRGRDATSRRIEGSGLGLYLARRILEAHGAELTVESDPNSGTVFRFQLKVA